MVNNVKVNAIKDVLHSHIALCPRINCNIIYFDGNRQGSLCVFTWHVEKLLAYKQICGGNIMWSDTTKSGGRRQKYFFFVEFVIHLFSQNLCVLISGLPEDVLYYVFSYTIKFGYYKTVAEIWTKSRFFYGLLHRNAQFMFSPSCYFKVDKFISVVLGIIWPMFELQMLDDCPFFIPYYYINNELEYIVDL